MRKILLLLKQMFTSCVECNNKKRFFLNILILSLSLASHSSLLFLNNYLANLSQNKINYSITYMSKAEASTST
jgi:hypothetical protein